MGFIQNKIEEIKKKPEHVRIRYAWMCAGSITLLVIIIWMFSLSMQTEQTTKEVFTPDQIQSLDNLKVQKDSLQDATQDIKNSLQIPANQQNQGVAVPGTAPDGTTSEGFDTSN